MRIMALDIGEKNIGIAISDKTNTLAIPFSVENNDENFEKTICELITEKDIGKIIVGIPYNLKGESGYQANKTLDIVEKFKEKLNVDIEFIDERFSTKISKDKLSANRKQLKSVIDKYAAAVILEDYLNTNKK